MKQIYIGLLAILAISCGSETTQVEEKVTTAETCIYNYDESSTKLTWTSYKFTEKTGVSGTFDEINVLISNPSDNLFNTLTGATFAIPVNSVNSENPERDLKIQDHFFGSMQSTEVISGLIKTIDETSALVEITMNGMSKEYNGQIQVEDEKVTLSTTIDLVDFEAQNSVDSLNSVCYDLHKGEDEISKLWSVVDIKVETTLKKDCK